MLVKVFYLWKFLRFLLKKIFFIFLLKDEFKWVTLFSIKKNIFGQIIHHAVWAIYFDGCPMANVPDDALIN